MTQTYIVHYAELGLKGKNRGDFEAQLIYNIKRVLKGMGRWKVRRFHSHIVVKVEDSISTAELEQRLSQIFGIAYLAPVLIVPQDMDAMTEAALTLAHQAITATTTFKVDTRRGDKRFPVKSVEVNRLIGAAIVDAIGAPVRLHNPDVTLIVQIYDDAVYLFARRIPGPGGLPLGISGRVLTLLSGGIDSPVAAYMLMKRGCYTDFMHFHMLPDMEQARASKIVDLARTVAGPHRMKATLYLVSALPFEMAMVEMDTRVTTVVFRRFVTRVAEQLAQRRHALALVTGESVGQVASQTLKNIELIGQPARLPILRPLIGLDKVEIIERAKQIGTYQLSIQPYKDPCSLHTHRPATWANLETVESVEAQIDIPNLLETTLNAYVEEVQFTWF
ncbi:MAG: tRNA 4-thiouridine(8) synthase ThiI [Anaerolineae bacterium]|nr:tRNA 4-thiouridine(8) synthase ThiI [Anaerolineae bacterium]